MSSIKVDRIVFDQANNINISNSGTTIVSSVPITLPRTGDVTVDGAVKYDPTTDSFLIASGSAWNPLSTNTLTSIYQNLATVNAIANALVTEKQQDTLVELVESQYITLDLSQGNYFHLNVNNSDTININVSYSSKYTEAQLFIDYLFSDVENSKWSINAACFSNAAIDSSYNFDINVPKFDIRGMCFKRDGTKMYTGDATNRKIVEYNLTTPWQPNTATPVGFYFYNNDISSFRGVELSSTGDRMYLTQQGGDDRIFEYALTTPYQVNTAVFQSTANLNVNLQTQLVYSARFSNNGTKLFCVGNDNNTIFEYTLATPWQVNTGVYAANANTLFTGIRGLCFGDNGRNMYATSTATDGLYQWRLSTPWQINTATYVAFSDCTVQLTNRLNNLTPTPMSIDTNQDGTKVYVADFARAGITEYALRRKRLQINFGSNVKISFLSSRNGGTTSTGSQNDVCDKIYIRFNNARGGQEYYVTNFDEGLTIWV
jgi:hypothetical protein